MPRKIIIDIETDAIEATCIWCVVCKELNGDVVYFTDRKGLIEYLKPDDIYIAHNGLVFDFPILNRLWGTSIKFKNVEDTLILSRLYNPEREGGHSLGNWGKKLGFNKIDFEDFSSYTENMLEYCIRDVLVTERVYKQLYAEGLNFSRESVEIEYRIAQIIDKQKRHGFYVDKYKAVGLFLETKNRAKHIEELIRKDFLPRANLLRSIEPRYTKAGVMSKVGLAGLENVSGPFSLIVFKDFNLASPKQIVERLNEYGWRPTMFTPKGAPKICEENLSTVYDTAPEAAKRLAEWKMLETRWKTVEAWLKNLDSNDRIHGTVFTMGAVTGRMTHANPNMANIVSNDKPYGKECRACFTVPNDNYRIVGMDAKGLELRMLAHYMKDPAYIEVVLNGDPHEVNRVAAGLDTRANSKRFIYAFLYGAGAEKLGTVVGGNAKDGARLKRDFLANMPSLDTLINKVQVMAAKGSLQGLDGRRICIRHQHASLNTLLQGAGAISCKQWSICMDDYIKKKKLRAYLVNTIHDEMQFEVHRDDVDEIIFASDLTMQKAGRILRVRLPLNADAKVGTNWAETH
tara:strand:- start:7009 stop:8724 length:1716 start_codon:yes stop_codon:yes gene_type:complete